MPYCSFTIPTHNFHRGRSSVAAWQRHRSDCWRNFWRNYGVLFSRRSEWHQLVSFDIRGEAQRAQNANAVPVHVDLIPGDSVARRLRNGVMIVVPSFAEGEQGNPKTIFRCIVRDEPTRTPH